jgi:dTDP-4-dehydrorhamnose 3,5-epimerase
LTYQIKTFSLEKHETKDIHDGHVNGSLIPVWRDWDNLVKIHPKMVYVTTIEPHEIKGPHLHITRHYYFTCIRGKVVFIIRDPSGKYHEIESGHDNPVLIEVPKNFVSSHINLSNETSMILCLANPAWSPNDKDEHNVVFDDYNWKKWESYTSKKVI